MTTTLWLEAIDGLWNSLRGYGLTYWASSTVLIIRPGPDGPAEGFRLTLGFFSSLVLRFRRAWQNLKEHPTILKAENKGPPWSAETIIPSLRREDTALLGKKYGPLSCLLPFRTGDDSERFEPIFQLFGERLERAGFRKTYPDYLTTLNPSPVPQGGFIVRTLWKRSSQNSEDLVAVWLPRDEERFDFEGWVCSGSESGAQELLAELEGVDSEVMGDAKGQLAQESKREEVAHYRDNLKELGPYSAIPVGSTVVTGLLPIWLDPQVISPVKDLLPWVFAATFVFLAVFVGLGAYYLARIIIAETGH